MYKIKCKKCKKIVHTKNRHQIYCGDICQKQNQKVIKSNICVVCNKLFERKHNRQKYCTNECKIKNQKNYYENNKKSIIAKNIYVRQTRINYLHSYYDNKCARCGFDKTLDLHHIDENSISIDTSIDIIKNNKRFISLCPNCHRLYHENWYEKQELENLYYEHVGKYNINIKKSWETLKKQL